MERLNELLAHENGLLVRRQHANIAAQLDYALRQGRLRRVLPGIYAAPEVTWALRMRAASAYRPDCVLTGAAAAMALWWPEVPLTRLTAAVGRDVPGAYPGFVWQRRTVPSHLVVHHGGLRIASPAVSILDLMPALGGHAVDEGLRRGAVSLKDLWAALVALPHRAGNGARRELLIDSRDAPWSEAERTAHRLLRRARIHGWKTNFRIVINGVSFYVDIAFERERVVIEIDGWAFHNSRQSFEQDRWRYGRLAAAGWTVLPFPASALEDDPDAFIALVREATGQRF